MKSRLYLIRKPVLWGINIKPEQELARHFMGQWQGYKILWPKKVDPETINPDIFTELKRTLHLKNLLLLDKIKNIFEPVYIKDHINISGFNFLTDKTPYKTLPAFPDVSHIYTLPQGEQGVVVKCVGGGRFSEEFSEIKSIINEWSGLISPVWNYVGIKITALGFPEEIDPRKIISYLKLSSSAFKVKGENNE